MAGKRTCIASLLSTTQRAQQVRDGDVTWTGLRANLFMLVEMLMGVACTCKPSFSKMLSHHLPPPSVMRSRLSLRLSLLKSRSGEGTARRRFVPLDWDDRGVEMRKMGTVRVGYAEARPGSGGIVLKGSLAGSSVGSAEDKLYVIHE